MMQHLLFLLFHLLLACDVALPMNLSGTTNGYSDNSDLNQLMESLFRRYNKEIMPRKPVVVSMDMLLLKVKTIVERDGIFESVIALFIRWYDQRITWDPQLYNNVTEIVLSADRIWLPDVAMTNAADHTYAISKDTKFVVRVNYQGSFDFIPTGTAKTWCDLKLLTFPFDVQTCSIEFESWALNSESLLFNGSARVLLDPSFSSLQFSICSYTAKVSEFYYEMSHESFSRLKFSFVVKRKSFFYATNLIFPIVTLSMIQPFVFLIPHGGSSSDRVGFATTNLLTLVVFQTIVTEEMPKTSDAVTTISKYIISLVTMSGCAIVQSILIERLMRTATKPPPAWLSYRLKQLCPIEFALNKSVKRLKQSAKDRIGSRRRKAGGRIPVKMSNRKAKSDRLYIVKTIKEGDRTPERKSQLLSFTRSSPGHLQISPASTVSVSLDIDECPNNSKFAGGTGPSSCDESDFGEPPKPVPNENWEDVIAKIDFVMFLLCFAIEIFVPVSLFMPILFVNEPCTPVDV